MGYVMVEIGGGDVGSPTYSFHKNDGELSFAESYAVSWDCGGWANHHVTVSVDEDRFKKALLNQGHRDNLSGFDTVQELVELFDLELYQPDPADEHRYKIR